LIEKWDGEMTWHGVSRVPKIAADVLKDLLLGSVYGWGAGPAMDIEMETVDESNINEVHALQATHDDIESALTRFSDVELNKLKLQALVHLASEFEVRLGRHQNDEHVKRSLVMKRDTLLKQLDAQKVALEVAHAAANDAEENAVIEYVTTNTLNGIVVALEKQEQINNEDEQSKKSVDIVCKDVVDGMIKQLTCASAGVNIDGMENIGDLFTRKRTQWKPDDKNKIIVLALNFANNVTKMLSQLKSEGHKLLPSEGTVSKWLKHYRRYGFFSEDKVTASKKISNAVSKGKLTSELLDDLIFGRILILLSLGMKTKRQTYKDVGKVIQATAEFEPVAKDHPHHKRNAAVQKLKFSNGWVDKFKRRRGLVRRIGDMQKLGKLPTLAEVSDNQEKCQIEYGRMDCHPALIATAGKFSFFLIVLFLFVVCFSVSVTYFLIISQHNTR
jgi:hypothetical protein